MIFDGIVFPGQASQCQYMGKDFAEAYVEAQEIFDKAKNSTNLDIFAICQNADQINQTEYTQPCILTVEIAIYRVLQNSGNFNPKFFAGHSLGEYAALVAAGVIPFEIAVKIVHFRGKLMQNGSPPGSMAAIIMEQIPYDGIKEVTDYYNVDIANDNSNKQIVISGEVDKVKVVTNVLLEKFGVQIRIVHLPVSAPFHSRYMEKIELEFREYLTKQQHTYNVKYLTKVVSNYYGDFYREGHVDILIEGLTKQLSGRVKWRDNMLNLAKFANNIIEVGPSCPLRSFFKSIGINIQIINSIKSMEKLFDIQKAISF